MNDKIWWYAARSGGIVAWVLLASSVLWGLALSTKVFGKRPRPNWLLDLHRFLGGLSVVFTAVHVVSILFDKYVTFTVLNVLVPYTGTWHVGAVAWGIVAMYMLVAVEITSLLRKRLSKQAWRLVHYLSFPLFAFATIHAVTAGTDRHTALLRLVLGVGFLSAAVLTVVRVWQADDHDVMTSPRVAPRIPPRDPHESGSRPGGKSA